ncbi:MAG: 6-phosphogluconolactonase [Chloroflexi bacterium]|nr:6-phosphogluconolactonase [Chloroflexota bacterium]
MTRAVEVFGDPEALANRAVALVEESVARALADRGRALVALSGGSTPRRTYELLGEVGALAVDDVDIFFADERCVPPDDHASNYRLVAATIGDHGNVRRVRGEIDPDEAAREYELILRDLVPGSPPAFDLMLLGIGGDGHTASLFPGSAELDERARLVVATGKEHGWVRRVTMTLPVLNAARRSLMLATGRDKARAVTELLSGGASPAARVLGAQLLIDEAAAGEGPQPPARRARPTTEELFDLTTEDGET